MSVEHRGQVRVSLSMPVSFGKLCADILNIVKGTHTVYFSSSLYIINQKPMIPRTHFHCITTWVACSPGWNSAMHLLILWFRFTGQMALLSNINFYFDCKARLCLIVPGRQEKNIFSHKKVAIYKVYSMT